MPKRIQRKRTKGWRMPPGAVYVGRPGRWSNPWSVVLTDDRTAWTVRRKAGLRPGVEVCPYRGSHRASHEGAITWSVEAFRRWLRQTPSGRALAEAAKRELRGRNLACWCPLGNPCHADVLLEIANPRTGGKGEA
ncbi:MAG: DUF4326 domain-containing protein [Parvularcula sp.]|jgi:hypothetical protein|nr:DUF4326 domain-containing protein [Parvularcula sp.]